MASKRKPNEIQLTRIFDAPVAAVWDAWTDPAQTAQWWGPRGFTLTTHAKDLRVGGIWHYTMHGPDGTDYPNKTLYHEVEKHAKLVYDHGGNDERAPLFHVTVLFSETGGKTRMDMTMALKTAEEAENTRKFIKKAGGDGTWDRLAEYLAKHTSGKDAFFINRVFDAPIDVMFRMWTDPKHVAQWTPPTGATMEFIEVDIRTGGESFYSMIAANGMKMYGRVRYLKIEAPDTLIYTQEFCDADKNMSRHPMAPTWPATMLTNVKLSEEEDGKTRVTVMWEPHGTFTTEERDMFMNARGGMTGGWTGSFDKLDAVLESFAAAA